MRNFVRFLGIGLAAPANAPVALPILLHRLEGMDMRKLGCILILAIQADLRMFFRCRVR